MIKAYLTWISTQYEGEDIEIRYCIYENEELLSKDSITIDYMKPAVLGQVAMIKLLKKLKRYKDRKIIVVINDGALYESAKGTLRTKNDHVHRMGKELRTELEIFKNLVIENISGNSAEIEKWNEILKP